MWMKSLPLAQPPNVKAQHGVLGGLDDSGSRRDGIAADVALNFICRPSGTRDSNLRVNPAFHGENQAFHAGLSHSAPPARWGIWHVNQHFVWGFHLGASGAAQCSSASLAEHHAHALAPALVNRHEVPIDLG